MLAGEFGVRNREPAPLRQRFFQIYTTRRPIVATITKAAEQLLNRTLATKAAEQLLNRMLASRLIRIFGRSFFVLISASTVAIGYVLVAVLPLLALTVMVVLVGGGLYPTLHLMEFTALGTGLMAGGVFFWRRGFSQVLSMLLLTAALAVSLVALALYGNAVKIIYDAWGQSFWTGLVFIVLALIPYELVAILILVKGWMQHVADALDKSHLVGKVPPNTVHVILKFDKFDRVEREGAYFKYPDEQVIPLSTVPVLLEINVGGDSGNVMVTSDGAKAEGSLTVQLNPDNYFVLAAYEVAENPEQYRSEEAADGVANSKRLLTRYFFEALNREVRGSSSENIAGSDASKKMEESIAKDARAEKVHSAKDFAWLLGRPGIGLSATEDGLLKLYGFTIGTVDIDFNVAKDSSVFKAREEKTAAKPLADAKVVTERGLGESVTAFLEAAGVPEGTVRTQEEVMEVRRVLDGQSKSEHKVFDFPGLEDLLAQKGPELVKRLLGSDNDNKEDKDKK